MLFGSGAIREEIKDYITELESMFELSELEEHKRNILKVGNYIKQLQQENQKYKEVIDKANKYINDNLIISSILDGKKYYTLNNYSFDYRELLEILDDKEVE